VGSRRDRALRAAKACRVTVGYYAPSPGSHSGVADYAETLKSALAQLGRVENNRDDADVCLYHLGNNALHANIYSRALARPGVVVLHDAVLHHFLLGTLSNEQYISEWLYNYGEWRRDLGVELWRDRARAGTDPRYFQFPLLKRVLDCSLAVIVHNPGAAAIARAHGARQVTVIPHFLETVDVPDAFEVARFRERIGVGQGTTLFGIFGYLREPKRVIQCIDAFRRLHVMRPDTALLLTGEIVSNDLRRVLNTEAAHPAIRRLGRLGENDFRVAGASVDCCLNLRYPGAGETSGIATRLMGMGRPLMVTDNAENSTLPDDGVLRISSGPAEAGSLFDNMVLITEFPGIAREIGRVGQHHVRQYHALDSVARQYWEVLCDAASSSL
jgi:glycosyltransferase involved in cell wall biosynthesis